MGYYRSSGPATEPLTLAEAKAQCSVDSSDFDDLLNALIVAARSWAENYTRRSFITQTWKVYLDEFPANISDLGPEKLANGSTGYRGGEIYLPNPPVIAISTFKYVATDGTLTTLTDGVDYQLETNVGCEPRLTPAYNTSWPATKPQMEAVQITYTAGYGAAAAVPQPIKQAMLLQIGSWFIQREGLTKLDWENANFAAKALLDAYVVWRAA